MSDLEDYERIAYEVQEEERRARISAAKARAKLMEGFDIGLKRAREREAEEHEAGEAASKAAQTSYCCGSRVLHTKESVICTTCGKDQP